MSSLPRPLVPTRALKHWSLPWWQLAHQTRQRTAPTDDPVFLARLHHDQQSSEVVLAATDLLIVGSNPLLALAAATHCSTFCSSIVVALARSPDHWNYPMATTPLFSRFIRRYVGGTDHALLPDIALDWVDRIHPSCKTGWVDMAAQELFHLSLDEPSGLMMGMWGPAPSEQTPWARVHESPRLSTREAYDHVWEAFHPALKQLGTLPFPSHPAFFEGPDRPGHAMVSKAMLLVSSLPNRVSQTVRDTDDGLFLNNEWGLPAVGSAAFVSTTARGHFEAPLRDLCAIRDLRLPGLRSQGQWPGEF